MFEFEFLLILSDSTGKKNFENMKAKWCNDSIHFQHVTVIPLDHLVEHAIIRQGNVLARMASLDWHVIDALEVTSRVALTSLLALVSIINPLTVQQWQSLYPDFCNRNSSSRECDDDAERSTWTTQWRSNLWTISIVGTARYEKFLLLTMYFPIYSPISNYIPRVKFYDLKLHQNWASLSTEELFIIGKWWIY